VHIFEATFLYKVANLVERRVKFLRKIKQENACYWERDHNAKEWRIKTGSVVD